MKIRLRGKFWKFVRRKLKNCRGYCDAPAAFNKELVVDSRLMGEEELEVIVHETMHGALWDLGEEAIEESARDISRVLWRLGYRRIPDVGH